MVNGRFAVTEDTVSSLEDFEKLVLAYDDSVRKDSPYRVLDQEVPVVEHGGYRYTALVFLKKLAVNNQSRAKCKAFVFFLVFRRKRHGFIV